MATSKHPVPKAQPSTDSADSADETSSSPVDPETEQRQRRATRAVLRAAHAHFGAADPLDLAAFAERYPDDAALKLAVNSRAHNTLRASAQILKQLLPGVSGEADHARGLRLGTIALVVEFARRVDEAIPLEAKAPPRAAQRATQAATTRDASARLASVDAALARAIGKNEAWRKVFTEGQSQASGRRRDHADRLERCALGLVALRAHSSTAAHSLTMEGLGADTERTLLALSEALESGSLALMAPLTSGTDSRELNVLEGRLLHALGDLLRTVRQTRQEGKTGLVLRVMPGLLRQLRLSRKTDAGGAVEAPIDTDETSDV